MAGQPASALTPGPLRQIKATAPGAWSLDPLTETTAMVAFPVRRNACKAHRRHAPGPLSVGAVLIATIALAACHRPIPPNVTPPGETAAFSEPSPGAPAARETEIPK